MYYKIKVNTINKILTSSCFNPDNVNNKYFCMFTGYSIENIVYIQYKYIWEGTFGKNIIASSIGVLRPISMWVWVWVWVFPTLTSSSQIPSRLPENLSPL